MLHLGFGQPKSVFCLGCHSDDIEIGCGGTLLRLLDQHPDLQVTWVVLSAAGERADEARQSAAAFLAKARQPRIVIGDFRDRYFPYQGETIKNFIHDLAGQVSPDLVFTQRRDDLHQDHRLVGELTWNAFRNHLILEYEIAKYEGDLGRPNIFVPLDESVCQRKIDTLLTAFPSQREKPWFTPDTFWALLRIRGLECNSPSRFAEGFHAAKVVL
ncbi:MAG: PIG-L deacetylase family protein [Pirellulales bacterium]